MINAALLMLAASTFMLNPPTGVSWGYVELQPNEGVDAQIERCGVSGVRVFSARANQIATGSFSDEQREAFDDVVVRIEDEWEKASSQERARLSLELWNVGSAKNIRRVDQTWVALDTLMVHYLEVQDMASGNMLTRLTDETTGQYVAVLSERGGDLDLADLMTRFLEAGFTQEELKAAYVEAFRDDGGSSPDVNEEAVGFFKQFKEGAEETTVTIEVNGVVRVLDRELQMRHGHAREVVAELWQHLPEGEGRRRIEMAISVVRRAVEHEAAIKEKMMAGSIVNLGPYFNDAPGNDCLTADGVPAGFRKGGGMRTLEAPPTEMIEDLFGEEGLPLPDPDWSFKRLKKELL